ncbi:MAG: hypothetical protein Q7K45_02275 [Nanoarchaeota archaeon]|nr:hypothetical protein [Nanoarchaeota archaeon]
MKPAPSRDAKVLCDFHAHPSKKNSVDDIAKMLGSPGLVGLAAKFIDKSGDDILLYEDAVDMTRIKTDPSFVEITPGKLAKYKQGYFARTQEIKADVFHLLAIGCDGDYLRPSKEYASIEEAVGEIHSTKGIAIFNHPYFVQRGGLLAQFANKEEEARMKKGYGHVDEIEVHNAFYIDFPMIAWTKKANVLALQSIEGTRFKGMASSDCHRELEQVKIAGNYIPYRLIDNRGMEGITDSIRKGLFQRYGSAHEGPYVNRLSWMKGVTGDIFSALR